MFLQDFFENREIFLTGGSGVVGKSLIEKLLRSCNVRKIYILLRPKGKLSIEQRLEEITSSLLFRQLKLRKPDELGKKLAVIPGDITLPSLGITPENKKILENVSIMFHCAATVRFDEPLKVAIKLNVGGTLNALQFAETLKHLEVFMHVSTLFSNPYLKCVEGKMYEAPMDWRVCLKMAENEEVSEAHIDAITKKVVTGFANTYCFTKNLSESLVNDYREKLPVAIYRPSIVLFCVEEPERGFASAMMGALGLLAVTGAGLMKTIYSGKDIRLDVTPQDLGVKTLCYYTFKAAQFYNEGQKPNEVPIYMFSSFTSSSFTFSQYISIIEDNGFWTEAAFEKCFLIPGLQPVDNRFLYMFLFYLKQLLPSLLLDSILVLLGYKPALLRANRKIYNTNEVLKPFLFNEYESTGTTLLDEMFLMLKGTEFNIDIMLKTNNLFTNLEILQAVPYSLRENLLKEDPKTLPRSRKIMKAKIQIYKAIKYMLAFKIYQIFLEYEINGKLRGKKGKLYDWN